MPYDKRKTTIQLRRETRELLKDAKFWLKADSYDDVICWMIMKLEDQHRELQSDE